MSTIIVIGGGPKPNARVVSVSDVGPYSAITYEIRDGDAIVATSPRLSHLQALLPLIQSGE